MCVSRIPHNLITSFHIVNRLASVIFRILRYLSSSEKQWYENKHETSLLTASFTEIFLRPDPNSKLTSHPIPLSSSNFAVSSTFFIPCFRPSPRSFSCFKPCRRRRKGDSADVHLFVEFCRYRRHSHAHNTERNGKLFEKEAKKEIKVRKAPELS
jgi:hypothetical protein